MYVCVYIYIYIYIYNRVQPLKRFLETLFLAIKKCTGFTTDASQPTQSSSRRVSSLKDTSDSSATTLSWFTSVTEHFCALLYNICGEASELLYFKEQSF